MAAKTNTTPGLRGESTGSQFATLVSCDPMADVLSFLAHDDQRALWQTSLSLRSAFCHAVSLQRFIGLAACHDPQGAVVKQLVLPALEADHQKMKDDGDHGNTNNDAAKEQGGLPQLTDHQDHRVLWVPVLLAKLLPDDDDEEFPRLTDGTLYVDLGFRGGNTLLCQRTKRIVVVASQPAAVSPPTNGWFDKHCAIHEATFLQSAFVTPGTLKGLFRGCAALQIVDFTGGYFPEVDHIEDDFLSDCRSLTSINLRGLVGVTAIGGYFLYRCSALRTVDLTPMKNVTRVGHAFCCGCSALESIDLQPLHNVRMVDRYFLSGCSSLGSIDLIPLSNVTLADRCFMSNCRSLREIDLNPLQRLTVLPLSFLSECTSLQQIEFGALTNITQLEASFLSDCRTLKQLDFSGLVNVTAIGPQFLSHCSALKPPLDLSPLVNVTAIESGAFLATTLGEAGVSFPREWLPKHKQEASRWLKVKF